MLRLVLLTVFLLVLTACHLKQPVIPDQGRVYAGKARELNEAPAPPMDLLIENRSGKLLVYLKQGETQCLGTFKPISGNDSFLRAFRQRVDSYWELQFYQGSFTGNCRDLAEAPRGVPRPLALFRSRDAYTDYFEFRVCRTTGSCFDSYLTSDSLTPQD
ncbi:MAG: hypothetical protein RRB13_13400 [bacterium]|nr:hypothetical protein [bacterium]